MIAQFAKLPADFLQFALDILIVYDRRIRDRPFFLGGLLLFLWPILQILYASVMLLDLSQGPALGLGQYHVQKAQAAEVDHGIEEERAGQCHAVHHVEEGFVGDRGHDVGDHTGRAGCAAAYLMTKAFEVEKDPTFTSILIINAVFDF